MIWTASSVPAIVSGSSWTGAWNRTRCNASSTTRTPGSGPISTASVRAHAWEPRMEREANYAAVGAFVLLVALLGVLFVYWYSDTREHRNYNRYEIYFTGSVGGLDGGAPVRYLGVGAGRVVDRHIDPRDSSRVEVIVDIDATTPISEHTVAELGLQGVTGLLYIDLLEDRTSKRPTPPVTGLKYPVIRSGPS